MSESKKFYWIKLRTDFFGSDAMNWLQSQENGYVYIVLYLRLCLITSNTNGLFEKHIGEMIIPYEPTDIARDTQINVDIVRTGLTLFMKMGLIMQNDNGILYITNLPQMVGTESANRGTERVRRFRAKEKQKLEQLKTNTVADTVTKCNADTVTKCNADTVTKCNAEIRDKRLEIRDKSIESRDRDRLEIEIGKDRDSRESSRKKSSANNSTAAHKSVKPTLAELKAYIAENGYTFSAEAFIDYYESNGWKVGRNPMKSWQATCRTWQRHELPRKEQNSQGDVPPEIDNIPF